MNILYVEDDARISGMAKEIFLALNHSTVWCDSVDSAIKSLVGNKIDLVLLDLKLDNGHGTDLLAYMEKKNIKIPVIVISGEIHSYERDIKHYLNLGLISEVYPKPFKIQNLMLTIENIKKR
jgi:DNA-binding response OmpR family regulator